MLHGVSWINIQLALADGARMKDRDKDGVEEAAKPMTNDELKEYFNNRKSLK